MRRVLLTLFVLFVAVAFGALWYASNRGFTSKWRQHVMDEFHKRGVEVTLRHMPPSSRYSNRCWPGSSWQLRATFATRRL